MISAQIDHALDQIGALGTEVISGTRTISARSNTKPYVSLPIRSRRLEDLFPSRGLGPLGNAPIPAYSSLASVRLRARRLLYDSRDAGALVSAVENEAVHAVEQVAESFSICSGQRKSVELEADC